MNKGAFGAYEQSQNDIRVTKTDKRTAIEYWQDELVNKADGTKYCYLRYFNEFLKFVNMTADEVINQRIKDVANPNRKIQRRFESLFKAFLAEEKKKRLESVLSLTCSFPQLRENSLWHPSLQE